MFVTYAASITRICDLTKVKQSYSTFDVRSSAFTVAFLEDAEKLWRIERSSETPNALAAQNYLYFATMSGKEHLRAPLAVEVRELGIKMKYSESGRRKSWFRRSISFQLRRFDSWPTLLGGRMPGSRE